MSPLKCHAREAFTKSSDVHDFSSFFFFFSMPQYSMKPFLKNHLLSKIAFSQNNSLSHLTSTAFDIALDAIESPSL